MVHLLVSLFPKLTVALITGVVIVTLLMLFEITRIKTKSNLSVVTIVSVVVTALISITWKISALLTITDYFTNN